MKAFLRAQLERYNQRLAELDFLLSREDIMKDMPGFMALSRERTEEDQRANAVAISPAGRKALRGARNAADRAERALLEALPIPDRQKFVKALSQIAQAAEQLDGDGGPRPRRNLRRRKLGG